MIEDDIVFFYLVQVEIQLVIQNGKNILNARYVV